MCQENGKAFNETDGEFKEEMVRDKTRDICKTQIMKSLINRMNLQSINQPGHICEGKTVNNYAEIASEN